MTFRPPVRVVVVDDQSTICKQIKALIQQQPGFTVAGDCGTVREALTLIPSIQPDLIFLDVLLADGNGFDILEQIKPTTFKVIFLTAYQEHAIKAIKYGALDYILKPIDHNEFISSIQKLLQSQPPQTEQLSIARQQYGKGSKRIVISTEHYLQIIDLQDIIFCHSDAGYTTFHLVDDRKIVTSKYIKEYEYLLPNNQFLRPHKSYLVNQLFIDKYHKGGYLILKNKIEIPVSVRRREQVVAYFKSIH